ncbi:MAG: hypothetical protein RR654_00280 [Oscillospiraceae bacterium]
MINSTIITLSVHLAIRVSIVYLMILTLLFIDFIILFKLPYAEQYWCAMHFVLHLICVRGIVTSLLALITRNSLFAVMASETQRLVTLIIALMILTFGMNIQLRTAKIFEKLKQLFRFKSQLYFINTIGSVMLAYQLFCTDSFFHSIDFTWLTLMLLFGALLTLTGYYMVFFQSIRASVWVHNTWRTEALEVLLKRQLLHYRSYEQYTTSIRVFKHDYNKIIASIRSLLRANEPDKALCLLEDMDHCLQENISVHKQYSDDMLVDAVLHELADECLELKADFSASVTLPIWLNIPQLELNKLFTSLCQELSLRCALTKSDVHRHIKIIGEANDEWLSIVAETSFDGALGDLHQSYKMSDEFNLHSMTLPSLREVVALFGGFVNVEADTVQFIYKVNIHISSEYTRNKGIIL